MIDAHHHFWELGRFDYGWLESPQNEPIRRDYLPQDLLPHLARAGITQTVFVQTQHNVEETLWVLELARQHPFIAGIVGWVDLADPDCEAHIERLQESPKFAGIRHVVQDEPDDDFIVQPAILRGLKVLEKCHVPYDLLFYVKHLHHTPSLARACPELPLVIDHLSKPEIKSGQTKYWAEHLRRAAAYPNVHCKLSGMVTEADWEHWKPSDLKPYIETALEAFGPERCMYGSDWPVCELAANYEEVHSALKSAVGTLSDTEQDWIFDKTAASFYGLDEPT